MYYLRYKGYMVIMVSHNGNIRHCARSALRPAAVGIRPLLGSFHWSAFGRSAFRHAPLVVTLQASNQHLVRSGGDLVQVIYSNA